MKILKLTVLALLMVAPACSGDLTVNITGVDTRKGTVIVTLTNSESAWNNEAKSVAIQAIAARMATGSTHEIVVRFTDLPAGVYAVLVLHDQNDNRKLDTNFLGIPSESYGFSNNPKVMRKAYFGESKFEVGTSPSTIVIHLH